MKHGNKAVAFGALAAVLCAGSVAANAALSRQDHEFATMAAATGTTEVKFGELAAKQAGSPAVKQFGQQMVAQHTAANTQFMDIAKQKNIILRPRMDGAHQAEYDKLSTLHGAAFDSMYMKGQIADHKMVLAGFQKEAESGSDPDVKGFAAKTAPTVAAHLRMAQRMAGGRPMGGMSHMMHR